eukprot:6493767-Pyramimonas_sp.AAC.1
MEAKLAERLEGLKEQARRVQYGCAIRQETIYGALMEARRRASATIRPRETGPPRCPVARDMCPVDHPYRGRSTSSEVYNQTSIGGTRCSRSQGVRSCDWTSVLAGWEHEDSLDE